MKNKKSLGQHWLKNRAVLDEIAELSHVDGVKHCLEIGPGLGTLTSSLLKVFDEVMAVEFDENLANNLPKSFPGKNLKVINEDFLKFDLGKIEAPYVVAGNIPYYITSPIINKVIAAENQPEKIVFLIQKEVAERIASEKESVLSLTVKNRATVELGPVVKAEEFTPPPEVDSQVIILTPHQPIVPEAVFELIKLGFKEPRKKVVKNLSSIKSRDDIKDIFAEMGLNVDSRPHELHLADWQKIYERIYK